MPANFTEEEKKILLKKFYEQGYILLKKYGFKKLKVCEIASSVGIATGTFYNFFKSKDEYLLWLIKCRKEEAMEQFLHLAEEYPKGIPFDAMEQYLIDTLSHSNIYRCLTQEDYNLLQKKFGLLDNKKAGTIENAKSMLGKLATTKSMDDFLLFSEAYTIIIIGTSDLSKLNPDLAEQAIRNLVHSACQILY